VFSNLSYPHYAELLDKSLRCIPIIGTTIYIVLLNMDSNDVLFAEQYGICIYVLNPEFSPMLEKAGLRIAGVDLDGEVRIMELDQITDGHLNFLREAFAFAQ
jgi:hypothetical protein